MTHQEILQELENTQQGYIIEQARLEQDLKTIDDTISEYEADFNIVIKGREQVMSDMQDLKANLANLDVTMKALQEITKEKE